MASTTASRLKFGDGSECRNRRRPAACVATEADGTYAEEDIRNGVYWTRFELTKGDWIPVPADVVIKDPNRNRLAGGLVGYMQDGTAADPLLRAGWRGVS